MNDVVVLIPHFNNPEGLKKSIDSISEKVDVVVVDDGSRLKPNENDLTESFPFGTILFHYFKENRGIEDALNVGLEIIEATDQYLYIARLDCGDICAKNRFQLQRTFLKENEEYGLVGSHCTFVNMKGEELFTYRYSGDHEVLKKKMYFNSMFIHPTVMFRTEVLNTVGYYPTNYKAAEDYAFFFKILKRYKTSNIQEVLVLIEYSHMGISAQKRNLQVVNRIKIIWEHFYFGHYPIVGLLRSCVLYLIPLKLLNRIKQFVK